MSESLRKGLAQALLPAAILPVLFLGPGLMRSPQTLWRRASAELTRLTSSGHGGHGGARGAHHARGARRSAHPTPEVRRPLGSHVSGTGTARISAGQAAHLLRSVRYAPLHPLRARRTLG